VDHSVHAHKKWGEIAPVVPPKGAKTCFVFLSPSQHGLLDIYPASISTIFETTDMNGVLNVHPQKFPNFCLKVLQAEKTCPGSSNLGVVLIMSVQHK